MDHPMPGQPMFGVSSESDSGAGGRVHADPPPRRVAGGADDLPSTLLLVGGAGGQPDLAGLAGVRLAGPVPADAAPSRGAGFSRFDIVWLREAERLADDRFAALMEVYTEGEWGQSCAASLAGGDPVVAAHPRGGRTG